MRTPQSETRVVPTGPNNGYSADGRWLAQYHDDSMGGPWFDIGDPHDTQAEAILATLPHPDAVGESEYRAVHELIESVIASIKPAVAGDANADDEVMDTVLASLNELIESATTLRRAFKSGRLGSQLAKDLLALEAEALDASGSNEDGWKYRKATEMHGKLRKAWKEIDKMAAGPRKDECQQIATRTARIVLVDIFGLDPNEVASLRV
jgi:hypothetical protein